MAAKITEDQKWELLEGIACGRPIGELAGIVGVSSPTITNRLANPAFLAELVALFDVYDESAVEWLEAFERWEPNPLERRTQYALRHRVAKLIRAKFHNEDLAEQEEGRRRGWLKRGGITWKWDESFKRWKYGAFNDSWWRGSIGGADT